MVTITRAVTVRDLDDLLSTARFATVAWNRDGQVAAEPAAFRFVGGKYFIGLAPGLLTRGTEVAALVDEGPMYFDLRGVRVRGRISATDEIQGRELAWFEVEPEREVAWNYGMMRER